MSTPAAGAAILAPRRSSRFVAWVRAWRAGLVPFDEVADAVAGTEEHLVADAPGTWTDVPLREALPTLAKLSPDEIRLVLPAPGDPRGLPGPGDFAGAALLAGEAVIAGALGLIPEVRVHTSGSGDTFETVLWRVHPLPANAPAACLTLPGAAEAEAELAAALADTTAALTRLDVAQWRPELAGALEALRRPDGTTDLPPVSIPGPGGCSPAPPYSTGCSPWPGTRPLAARSTTTRPNSATPPCARSPPPAARPS
ncbi:hypothetical protein GCM10029963_70830 [Micromonospora andamanensis]